MNINIDEIQSALNLIRNWVTFIYDHESDFIKEFLNEYDVWDITNISFSGSICYVSFVMHSGQHASITFKNDDIIDWMGSQ